jgi:5-methylcytosine-specific restriction protein A
MRSLIHSKQSGQPLTCQLSIHEHSIQGRRGSLAEQFEEGDRIRREVTSLARNPKLVAEAKKHYGSVCRTCDFDFKARYGELGSGYIECHHVDPLSGRDGRSEPTTIADVTVLCANCHRMVHRRRTPCLTLEELKLALNEATTGKPI